MKKFARYVCCTIASLFALSFFMTAPLSGQESKLNGIKTPTLAELRENFTKPHRDYSTGPLWTWNDRLTETQVRETLQDLASQNVRQVWVHPRPGLMTPYLSNEWFSMWKIALDEAEKLDMNVWIYDENSYPSGFAGGFVPEALPDCRGRGLVFEEIVKANKIDEEVRFVFKPIADPNDPNSIKYVDVTKKVRQEGKLEQIDETGSKWLIARIRLTPQRGWFGGKWYVDLLKKGVTEKFIEITFDAYKNVPEIQKEFGHRVLGIFTDEPHLIGAATGQMVHWNGEIPKLFEERFGYSLIKTLPSLSKPVGDWKKVRHNFHQLLLELFAERWAKPCFEWCEANGLEFTGHYWEHGWPGTSHCPDNMAMYIWHQRPAIDLLMNTYNDSSPNAQFGNVRSVKELASIASQMGRSRTLSENYGAGGWDLRFEDMKRLGDWSYALGVNTNNEHLSYVTLRGARKRDHPQSFSYHVPWFEGYHVLADYFTRLSYVLSQGRQVNRIVVIEPTTTTWIYQGDPKLAEIGKSFTELVNALENSGIEYDLASEDTIARFGKVDKGSFCIGQAKYQMVVLPPNSENIQSKTLDLLSQFKDKNNVLCLEGRPERVDGKEADEQQLRALKTLGESPVSVLNGLEMMVDFDARDGFQIDKEQSSQKTLFHHRRELDGFDLLFVTNTSLTDQAKGQFFSAKKHVELWSLETGERCLYPQRETIGARSSVPFKIPACGSLLFVLSDSSEEGGRDASIPVLSQSLSGSEAVIERLEPNVLTLDYVDVKIGNEERKGIYTYPANLWIFQKHGMDRNPWDSCVQFRDELITKTFPEGTGFEATYRFTVAPDAGKDVLASLSIVIERPDLYEITCNGVSVSAKSDAWWLDKSFGVIDLSQAAKAGENEVHVVATSMTIYHELEPAYLLGDFSLESVQRGFVVTAPRPLQMQSPDAASLQTAAGTGFGWNQQGMPFYAGKVRYSRTFEIGTIAQGKGYSVHLPKSPSGWYGATAQIVVNGQSAGFVICAPWSVNVSNLLKEGTNKIDVIVYGTPKNLLGPHHSGKLRGSAWPRSFQVGPDSQPSGEAYDTINYGLFEPFGLTIPCTQKSF